MGLYDMTMQDVFCKNALIRADKTAFVSEARRWSFAQYHEDMNRLASGLAARGVTKSARIAVLAFNCYEFFLLYGAAAQLGAVIVPVNWRLKPEEIRFILEDAGATTVVLSEELADELGEVVDLCRCVSWRIVVGGRREGFDPFEEIPTSGREFVPVPLGGEDPFVIMYTAAVDGRPKGAVLSHENIVAASLQVMLPMKIDQDAVYVNLMPLFHIMGLEMAVAAVHAGGRNVIQKRFDARHAAGLIEREQATVIATVPPILSDILQQSAEGNGSLGSIRTVASLFDDPGTIRLCQETTDAVFWSGFGQTETSGYITMCPYDERPGSSGREGPMVRVRVVDDSDRPVATGKTGEIVVRGPVTFRGYWNAEAATRQCLRDEWHHTGDLGRLDEKGYLWYEKRKADKDLIKTGGENVYPAEVEHVLLAHEGIAEACVFGVSDVKWGEAIKAVCVRKPGSKVTSDELVDLVASRLARYKRPKCVLFVDNLPKMDNGCIDRERVRDLTLQSMKWTETE
ncbi:MAG: AMP-binding protein [Thermodesulfobacteriota bacterium]